MAQALACVVIEPNVCVSPSTDSTPHFPPPSPIPDPSPSNHDDPHPRAPGAFVLVDVYKRVLEWRQQTSVHPSWHDWKEFIESSAFENALWVFARSAFKIASGMVPTGEEARKFFRRKEAAEKYFRVAPGSKSLRSDMNREWQRWEKRMRAEAA